ncbi:MAG: hypothetical protein L0Y68_05380 [Candidatus Dadabacteria bacterium]|nr:hypothetical protein [Candidatus Dadabacteria bacterium]
MSETCVKTTLATFPYGNIQKCSCGGYYVTFGYVTIRLSYKELKSYADMLYNVIKSQEFTREIIQEQHDKADRRRPRDK